MLSHPKVLPLPELLMELLSLQAREKNIVFTNGCYDILHPGHVNLLARAKALGDILVLALNDDDSVRRQGKGTDRPINPLEVRMYMVAHLAAVDYVTFFSEDTPYDLIKAVRPQILIKGGDWAIEKIVGRDTVEADGGEVVALPLLTGFSTTALIQTIRSNA